MSAQSGSSSIGRRAFLAGTAAGAFTIVKPSLVRGSQANSTVEIGMIGCGGRGTWIAPLFNQHGGYRIVACNDYYEDHADRFGDKFDVPANRRYTTLSGYKRLLDCKLDAVVIESPPYFHPEHAAAAVDAGKHVFLAKPIAVDVPGCLTIGEAGRKATAKKLVYLIDFQTRANEHYREVMKRVHRGDIGRLTTVQSHYPCSLTGGPNPENDEQVLKRWYCIKALSGDFIVEQSIHSIDVATWFLNTDPIMAYGAAVSKDLRLYGNIMDNFNVIYYFTDDLVCSFTSTQCIPGLNSQIPCRAYGADGWASTDYFDHAWIKGKKPYESGRIEELYTSGAVNNIADFHKFIVEGNYANETVVPSVRSNLTAILGREAACKKTLVNFKDLLAAKEKLEFDLGIFKS